MREKNYEIKLRKEIKKRGGVALKMVCPGHAGATDRIVLVPDELIWFVEAKKTGKDLSPLQKVFKKLVERMAFKHRKIDSMQSVDNFLAEVDAAIRKQKQRTIEGL